MNLGYHKIIMDIPKVFNIQKCILGYPQIDFWISIIHIWISKNQCIYGYPKILFWISKNPAEFRISIISFLNIYNSILGYPKIGNISMY